MKITFRWYGADDPVTLQKIRQIPCVSDITTAVYKQVGTVWEDGEIAEIKKQCNDNGLTMEVIESIPVHEDIKLGRGNYKEYIEVFKENIRRVAKAGVKCVCYNFMPVFDWMRTAQHLLYIIKAMLIKWTRQNLLFRVGMLHIPLMRFPI